MKDLKYEPLVENHVSTLQSLWGDEEVIRFTNIQKPCSSEEIRKRIDQLKAFDVVAVRYGNDVVGVMGCPCIGKEKYGIFYQFKKTVWNQGIAKQAMKWLLNYMENKYPDAILHADVVADNIASEKILRSNGFQCVSIEENGFERNGKKMTILSYRKRSNRQIG